MLLQNRKICEGVNLTVIPTDKFKSNLMIVELRCPLRAETATHYSLLTNVLSRCCREYPSLRSFNIALEEMYAADVDAYVSKSGEVQRIRFKLSCIENAYTYDKSDVLAGAMHLLGAMIFDPLLDENGAFPDYVVESEKKNLKEEIQSIIDDKARFAISRLVRNMCSDESYSVAVAGDEQVLEGIDGASLKESYDYVLANAPVDIYFVGNTPADTVKEYIEKHLPFTPRPSAVYLTEIRETVGELKRVTEEADAVQSRLCMGYRTGISLRDEDYPALLLACDVLGSPSGKLFLNVREKLGLCYYCSPLLDGVKGLLIISAGIDAADRSKAEEAIAKQVEELKKGNISESELTAAKVSAATAYKEIYDSPGAMINWFATRIGMGISITPEEMAEKVAATTAEDIAAAARRLTADTFFMLEGEGGDEI